MEYNSWNCIGMEYNGIQYKWNRHGGAINEKDAESPEKSYFKKCNQFA